MASEFYKEIKRVCKVCGKIENITVLKCNADIFENNTDYICEGCETEMMKPVVEKIENEIKNRGHYAKVLAYKIIDNEDSYFFKYNFKGKNFLVVIEK